MACVQCTLVSVWYSVYNIQCTVFSVQNSLYSIYFTVFNVGCKDDGCGTGVEARKAWGSGLFTACTLCSAYYIAFTVHSAVYIAQCRTVPVQLQYITVPVKSTSVQSRKVHYSPSNVSKVEFSTIQWSKIYSVKVGSRQPGGPGEELMSQFACQLYSE